MTTTSYIIAWAIYLLAATIASVAFWKLSEPLLQNVRTLARVSILALLFTPYFSDPQQFKLAPAALILFFELVFGDKNIALHAITPLIIFFLIGMVISLLNQLLRKKNDASTPR